MFDIKRKKLPIIMAGTAIPATRAIPTGAPTNVPNCQSIFFFLDQGFLPQNVHPDGLKQTKKKHIKHKLNGKLKNKNIPKVM